VNATVQLLDTNEKPLIAASQEFSIGELAELGERVMTGVVNASDPEDGPTQDGNL